MYTALIEHNGETEYLYHPRDEELNLLNPMVSQEMGRCGNFEFRMIPEHPQANKTKLMASTITVLDEDEIIFKGRVFDAKEDFYGVIKVVCEGQISYLVDSFVAPYSMECSVKEFFIYVIQQHNKQVEEEKQFQIGNIQVTGDSDKILFESKQYINAATTILQNLVDRYGGHMHMRNEGEKAYIDYVYDYGGINEQPIRFGENLLDLNNYMDKSQVFTALIPTGARVEQGEEEVLLTIESVNDGKNYIFDQEAKNRHGWIFTTKSFDSVTDPEKLLALGKLHLKEIVGIPETITVNAIDLGIIDVDVSKMKTGFWTDVYSETHGLNKKFLLRKRSYNLLDPTKDKIILGKATRSLSGMFAQNVSDTNRTIQKLERETSKEIIKKIQNATDLITGGTGGYLVIDIYDPETGKKKHPWRMLIMDTPDQATAKNVWQFNMNGLGFSRTGINGPYENAWTIDGNLVADFITAGTMLADRIRGGTLELGGTGIGKDGEFIVRDAKDSEIARIDINGLQAKYEVNGRDVVGFIADGKSIRLGDFEVQTLYGRQILQSVDECTGMSGEPDEEGKLYFWAGYQSDTRYGMLINTDLSTYIQDLWMARWPDEWFDSAEHNFPSSVKLNRNSFAQWPVGKMLVDGYQWQNWLIETISKIIDKLDRRISDLENM